MSFTFKICVAALAAALLSACGSRGGADLEKQLRAAELSLQAFDFDEARAVTEAIDTSYHMLPSQLCREALIYARLSEACDSPDDMNIALRCYGEAFDENPDSVEAFAASLNVADRPYFSMLSELHHAIKHPVPPTSLEEMMDSIL